MDDDATHLTPLRQLTLHRRSHREYVPGTVADGDIRYVLGCAAEFQRRCGLTAPRIIAIPRGEGFDRITKAATTGLSHVVNAWLPSTNASHLLLCATVPEPGGQLVRAFEEAAMCMQVAVLAATELGHGTCWMTGINHERVEQAHVLPDGARLVAISPLGHPGEGARWSWDSLVHRMHQDRKALDDVVMREVWL